MLDATKHFGSGNPLRDVLTAESLSPELFPATLFGVKTAQMLSLVGPNDEVCRVKFAESTRDAKLRQPVFLGLRDDKDATEVVREKGHEP